MAIRVRRMESRLHGAAHRNQPETPVGPWMGQFTKLRAPKLYNLRADPFERGPDSIYYADWTAHRMFLLVPAQAFVGQWLESFKDFPPRTVQGFFGPFASRIVQIANRHRIGYMSNDRSAVAAGGLVSVSANFLALYEQAATYVDKILKGADPARLPVEQPSKFQITVNNRTVQALGLSISPTLVAQIDEVIE